MSEKTAPAPASLDPIPSTLLGKWAHDALSGFLVFLIALPLCLAISIADGFPPLAGVFTAIIGGIVVSFISNSELTIKGPAAGLIIIVFGAVDAFTKAGASDPYRMTLSVCVVAAAVQIGFALCRAGSLAEFFPTSVVHGMLASIGIIIIIKQVPTALGYTGKKAPEPLHMIGEMPTYFRELNPYIAIIGVTSVAILFLLPMLKIKALKRVPGQLIVVIVAVALGFYFNLGQEHSYTFGGHEYRIVKNFLVDVGNGLSSAITTPDFSGLKYPVAWKWVAMFAIIASLESLLSAKAVDLLDPWRRKTDFNRDLLGCGIGNLLAGFIGGSPMISEIVRSRANIDNGARTRWSNVFHGVFLLLFCWFLPGVISMIPQAALAGMLIFTGYRLANPKEFLHVFQIGKEQFFIYCATILGVVGIDLLAGIAIGIAAKFIIHLINGMSPRSVFKAWLQVEEISDDSYAIRVERSATFSNWISFRNEISSLGLQSKKNILIDFSGTTLVDHTVMEKLHDMEREFTDVGLKLQVTGLERHRPLSSHPYAARKRMANGVSSGAAPETSTSINH